MILPLLSYSLVVVRVFAAHRRIEALGECQLVPGVIIGGFRPAALGVVGGGAVARRHIQTW